MKLKVQSITISVFILIISSCSKSSYGIATATSPTTNTPTIQITYAPSLTPSPKPTITTIPVPTETIATCPSTPTIDIIENGLIWTEFLIPDKRYYHVVPDIALLKSCLDFPKFDEHDKEIYGERVNNDSISDLSLEIGDDLYETKYDETGENQLIAFSF